MTGPAGASTPRRHWALTASLAAVVVAAGYLHTLHYPFHFDDFDWIRDNLALQPPLDIAAIWDFRPSRFVANLTFALNRIITGESPASYRATNGVIHWLVALVVGWIAAQLAGAARAAAPREPSPGPRAPLRSAVAAPRGLASPSSVGLVATLFFAAHPLATQSVTYLTQRNTSLAALLALASVAAFLRARRWRSRPRSPRRWRWRSPWRSWA